ncbi:MAG: tetratricopeptide repeat protein [Planctomycetes bacterium]|nr:tetratricopeptide repeat protein [Planctomycetota bacterium]
MRVKRAILWAAVVAVFLAAGCDNHMTRKRNEAGQRWAESRAEMVTTLARRSYEGGNFSRAREQLDPVLRAANPYAPAYVLAARLAADQGRLDEARDCARTAVEVKPEVAEAHYVLGTIEQTLSHRPEALAAFAEAARLAPTDPRYALAEAEMLVATGQVDAAAVGLEAASDRMPGAAEVHAALGDVFARQGRYREAADRYRVALRLNPENTAPTQRLAVALFQAGAYAEAEPILAELEVSEPDFAVGWIRLTRADCLLALRQVDRARALYQRGVDAAPDDVAPRVGLARCDVLADRLTEAQRHLEEVLVRQPEHPEANGLLGYVLLATGRPGEAVPHLKLARNTQPGRGRETIEQWLVHAEQAVTRTP